MSLAKEETTESIDPGLLLDNGSESRTYMYKKSIINKIQAMFYLSCVPAQPAAKKLPRTGRLAPRSLTSASTSICEVHLCPSGKNMS